MKFRTPIAAVALSAAAVAGISVTSASAQDEPAPSASTPRRDFVCANLEQIQQLQTDRASLLGDTLALLGELRTAAEGSEKWVARIDRRIERVTERQAKVAERQEKLTAFAAENCAG